MLRIGSHTWTASYAVFDWVVDAVADRVSDAEVASALRVITDNNLGYLDPADLGAGEAEVLLVLRGIREIADRELPPSPRRAEVVAHIGEIAALVTDRSG